MTKITGKTYEDKQWQEVNTKVLNSGAVGLYIVDSSEKFVYEKTVDTTSYGTVTTYYYYDMEGYRNSSYQLELNSPSGTLTATFEGSIQDDGTAAASCTYQDITNDIFGVSSLVANGTTASDMWIDNVEKTAGLKYARTKIVGATSGGTVTIYHKRWY